MFKRKSYMPRLLDYDVGYLIKSPCRGCGLRDCFPGCMDGCDTLDRVQTCLAQSISSCRAHSPLEPFSVELNGRTHNKET